MRLHFSALTNYKRSSPLIMIGKIIKCPQPCVTVNIKIYFLMLVVWGISDYNHQLKKKLCFPPPNLPNLNIEEFSAELSYGFINTFPSKSCFYLMTLMLALVVLQSYYY